MADAEDGGGVGGRHRAVQHQANPPLGQPLRLHPQQRFPADKAPLVEPDPAIQAHVKRRVILIDVIAVEYQSLFQPQTLHRRHAVGLQAKLTPGLE